MKKIESKIIIAFVILLIAYGYFIRAITKDWNSWSGGWGYFWIGILTFIYAWIVYCFNFKS